MKITDGSNTLAFDTNEVHTTDNLYLNAEDGTIYLRGNDGGAVTLKNGGITFMNTTRDLQNIGTISSGTITSSGNVNSATVNSTGQIQTGYGVKFDNGATDFLLYNNANENQLYMRDITNGEMLTTWYTTYFKVNKDLDVTGVIKSNGTLVLDSSRNLSNLGTITCGNITTSGFVI